MIDTKLIRFLWFIAIFLLMPLLGTAQNKIISGNVSDENNGALPSANVTLVNESGVILAYSISDDSGSFRINLSSIEKTTNLFLQVLYLGYKKERQKISETISVYNFKLTPDSTLLDEVLIRDKPLVERVNDTIKFNVKKFAKAEDRSIGDVLNRMPGIHVDSDGSIYYNNERIGNLYIHGDDLMAGRYGLASRVIRKEDILSVDVMRNHQPIKVLKDKVHSDQTSINLVLKDEDSFKLSAQAQLGAGFPEQYDVALTPILLNKKVKILNHIAANNSGIDYRRDFKQLGTQNFISNLQSDKVAFSLSQGTASNPDLPTVDYYINNSASINLNNLYTFNNDLQVRLNIQGLTDENTLMYENTLTNYTANDTIVFDESQNLVNKPKLLLTSINLSKNEDNFFFNNNLKINFSNHDDNSQLNFNNESFSQRLSKNEFSISNDFNWIPKINKKGIAEFRLLTEYNKTENKLKLKDGYQLPIPQSNETYDNVSQIIELPLFYTDGYLSYKLPNGKIKQDYRIGYIREDRAFNSSLLLNTTNESLLYDGDVGNALNWLKNKYYFNTQLSFENKKMRVSLNLPIFYQSINYSQKEYDLNTTDDGLYFNPSLNFEYAFNVEKRINMGYAHQTNFGDISGVFRGVVLQNYRTLLSNNANLRISDSDVFNLKYSLENSAELLFLNGGITYKTLKNNNILSYNIEDNIVQSTLLPFENKRNNLVLNLGISKYLFAFKSKLSLNAQLSQSNFESIINEDLVPFKSNGIIISSNFSKSFLEIFTLDYNPRASWNFSKLESDDQDVLESISYKTFRLEQGLNLNITPAKLWNIKINSNYILIDQNNFKSNEYFLFNLKFHHNLKNDNLEFGIDITNLFDLDEYRLYSISDNLQINSNYQLRGRMIIARLNWYL